MSEQSTIQIESPDDYKDAVICLLNDASLSVDVFTPDLTMQVFGDTGLVAAVRDFAFRSRNGIMRILVRDARPLTRHDHRLLNLVQRISSKVAVRVLARHFHGRDDAFVIADGSKFALRHVASQWAGVRDSSRPEVARQLRTEFNDMWEHSLPDPGVRRLYI